MQSIILNRNSFLNRRNFFYSAIAFLFVFFFTGLQNYIQYPPQGIHFSRQMDSFAFSEYYLVNNSGLFSPGNLNLQSIDGKCASEFPIIYYIASLTYRIFGVNFLSMKIITLILLFFGFLFCVKIILLLSDQIFVSIFLSLVFFSSTVILYYGSLYLPDIHAFSLSLIGFYYFFSYSKTQRKSDLIGLYLFLTLASLVKASFFYYECVFFILMILMSKTLKLKSSRNLFLFSISFIIVAFWYIYARRYNAINFAYYYTTQPRPFWEYPNEKIFQTFYSISTYWYSKYYFQSTFHFFFFASLIYIFFIKKAKLEIWLILLLILFSSVYFCLFLIQFIDHDYYFIALMPSIIIIVSISVIEIRRRLKNRVLDYSLLAFIFVLAFLSLNYAKLNLHRRYTNNIDSYSVVRYELYKIENYLDSLKIGKHAKFIVVGDRSQNGSLVFLNKFGWTYSDFKTDSSSIRNNLSSADYLLVLQPSSNRIPEDILTRLGHYPKYTFNSNHMYSLENYNKVN